MKEAAGPQDPGLLKPLPAETCRAAIKQLAYELEWPPGIAFDGRKNMYTAGLYFPTHQTDHHVRIVDEDTGFERDYEVRIKFAAEVNIGTLLQYIEGFAGGDIPQDAIQTLDVALKHGTMLNPLSTTVNRAFFFPDPQATSSLGNGAEVGSRLPLFGSSAHL